MGRAAKDIIYDARGEYHLPKADTTNTKGKMKFPMGKTYKGYPPESNGER